MLSNSNDKEEVLNEKNTTKIERPRCCDRGRSLLFVFLSLRTSSFSVEVLNIYAILFFLSQVWG